MMVVVVFYVATIQQVFLAVQNHIKLLRDLNGKNKEGRKGGCVCVFGW